MVKGSVREDTHTQTHSFQANILRVRLLTTSHHLSILETHRYL